MNVEIENEATKLNFWEYVNRIFFAVYTSSVKNHNSWAKSAVLSIQPFPSDKLFFCA